MRENESFFSIQHATSSKIVFSSAICCVPYWTTLLSNSLRRDADFAEQKRSFKGKVGQANDGQFFGETWANITKATFEEVALNFYDLGLLEKALKDDDALLWQKKDFHYVVGLSRVSFFCSVMPIANKHCHAHYARYLSGNLYDEHQPLKWQEGFIYGTK